ETTRPISRSMPAIVPVSAVSCPSRRTLDLREHLCRRSLARAHRAVHVSVPNRGGLGAGPVNQADRLAERLTVGSPHAGREDPAVAATGELLPSPQHLDIAVDPSEHSARVAAEVPGEAVNHRRIALGAV